MQARNGAERLAQRLEALRSQYPRAKIAVPWVSGGLEVLTVAEADSIVDDLARKVACFGRDGYWHR